MAPRPLRAAGQLPPGRDSSSALRLAAPAVVCALALVAACGDDDAPACPPAPNLGECSRNADCCATEPCERRCVPAALPADGADMELACAAPRGSGDERARCTLPSDCASGLCLVGGRCTVPCASEADCDPSSTCAPRWVRLDGVPAEGQAHARVTACAPLASIAPLARSRLPVSDRFELAAAPRAAHQVLLPRCGTRPRAMRLEAGGEVLFDRSTLAPGASPPVLPLYATFPGPITLVVPNGPTYTEWDRPHVITFDEPASLDRLVFAPGLGTTLDLDVFVIGVAPPTDGDLETTRALLSSAGLALGEVRLHPIGGALADRLSVIDGVRGELPELDELTGLGAGLGPSAPVFLVRHVDFYLGLSGGNPGPLAVPGAPGAGVVVSAEDAGPSLGLVLAHELGHLLGLFHLVEPDGTVREPLTDTPACPPSADADGDGVLSADECAGQGAENPMFWSLERATPNLTPQQGDILRTAPVLR